MESKDIENPEEEYNKLTQRFKLLHDRFLAVAMDYKHYIEYSMDNHQIYRLRNNVMFRLNSAQFHLQLLLEYHKKAEYRLQNLFKNNPRELFQGGFELDAIRHQSTIEIYSLFDSMLYHLCSIFDYLFRLINFVHGKVILESPKWNSFRYSKNLKDFNYCSKEIFPKLKELDETFVYPLFQHRSYLIHIENETGEGKFIFNLYKEKLNIKFHTTKQFMKTFPELQKDNETFQLTIKYASFWLIDKTLKTITEILFEIKEDMIRNKKIEHGMRVLLGPNNVITPLSLPLWGERNIT